VQSNNLILARYNLSIEEQKIIKILISKIQKDDKDFKDYEFRVTELAEMLGMTYDNPYVVLRGITKRLITRGLEFRDTETKKLLQTAWLSSALYAEGEGTISLRFDPYIKPLLLELKTHFTMYELGQIMQFRGQYTIRFFEFRKSHIGRKKYEVEFTIEELWKILGLKNDEYKLFKDFKNYVIEPARLELLEKTGKSFSWETIKQGRGGKIVAVKFIFDKDDELDVVKYKKSHKKDSVKEAETIESKPSESANSRKQEDKKANLSYNEKSILEELMSFGMSDRKSRFILEEYNIEKIQEKIDMLKRKGDGVKNSPGFLILALDEDWKDEKLNMERQKQEESKKAGEREIRKNELKKFSEKFDKIKSNIILKKYSELEDDIKNNIKKHFIMTQTIPSLFDGGFDANNIFFREFLINKLESLVIGDFFKNEGMNLTDDDMKLWKEIRS